MELRFNPNLKTNRTKVEIPGITMNGEPFWIEISQLLNSEITNVARSSFITHKGRQGASQYVNRKLLLDNQDKQAVAHIHGWNLIDAENKPVKCTPENVKLFLDGYGNYELDYEEENSEGEMMKVTIKDFLGNRIVDPKTFISGDSKNSKASSK